MKEILLHLGLHKTGTTLVQKALFASKDRLAERGVLYAGQKFNLNVLGTAFADDPLSTHLSWKWQSGVDELVSFASASRDAVERELRESSAERALLSAEVLTLLAPGEVERVVAWLRGICPNVRALVYVRSTAAWSSSYASQLVRGGARLAEVVAEPPVPRYRQRLEPWVEALGADAVRGRCYDRIVRRPGGMVVDVLDQVGLTADAVVPAALRRRFNPSLSFEAVHLLEALRERRPPERGSAFDRASLKAAERVAGVPFVLPPKSLARAVKRTHADVEWLRATLGVEVENAVPKSAASAGQWAPESVESVGVLIGDLVAALLEAGGEVPAPAGRRKLRSEGRPAAS